MTETNNNTIPENTQTDRESRLPVLKEKKPKQREQILQFMISWGFPVSPSFIEYKLGIKASSASKVLGLLLKDGEITKLSHGEYIREPTRGVGGVGSRFVVIGPLVHNVNVYASGVNGVESGEVVLERPYVRVVVTFGEKRGKVSYRMKCTLGLGPVGLAFVHDMVVRLCKSRGLNISEDSWMATRWEWFTDVLDARLEGVQAVTLHQFLGNLVKYYNKPRVRTEVVPSSHPVKLGELQTFLGHGLETFQVHRELNDNRLQMASLQETMKYFMRDFREARRDLIE